MPHKIQLRRGLKQDLPALDNGEVGFAQDTEELFIGSSSGNKKLTFDATKYDSYDAQLADIAYVSVRKYGVVGDGVADDSDKLEQAISDSMLKGKGLDFGSLTIKTSRMITIPNGKMYWKGQNAIIKPNIPATATTIYWFDNHNATDLEVYIEGITFDGNDIPLPSTVVARIPLSFQGTIANPVKSIILKECKIQNLLWEEAPNVAVDHATRFYHAKNVKVLNCEFKNVKGWSVFLQDVDGFEISGNKSDGNYFGAIEMRGSCRNGSVYNNQITNCNGAYSGAIDFLGVTDEGLSENVKVYDNTCQGQFVYNVGLRVVSAKKIHVHNNTIIMEGSDVTGNRQGITVGTKLEALDSLVQDIVVENNTVITTADSYAGLSVINNRGNVCKNIFVIGNKFIESGGTFKYTGIRVGQTGNPLYAFQNVHVLNNRIEASVTSNASIGGIAVIADDTDVSKTLKGLWVEGNLIVNKGDNYVGSGTPVGIYLRGLITEGKVTNNTIKGFYYPIEVYDYSKISGVLVSDNDVVNCVVQYGSSGLFNQPSIVGTNGKPSETSSSIKNVSNNTIFIERNPAANAVKGWFVTGRGSLSTQTITGTGTLNTSTITVSELKDFVVGDEIKITGISGTNFIMKINGNVLTLNTSLSASVTNAVISHQAPVIKAMQFPTSGTTAQRPTTLATVDAGYIYYDTTLLKPVFWNGSSWLDGTGATV